MTSATEQTGVAFGQNHSSGPSAFQTRPDSRKPAGRHSRKVLERFALRLTGLGLSKSEYFAYGLDSRAVPFSAKRQFAGARAAAALNALAAPSYASPSLACLKDKLFCTQLLGSLGLATARTQALVSGARKAGDIPVLNDAAQLDSFFRNDALYPLFCKPLYGGSAIAPLRLECIDGHTLSLCNGETRHVSLFADEVLERCAEGYLLQTAIDSHPQMVKVVGRAVGSVRVVTTHDGLRTKPAYALWRIPAPGAMSDSLAQDGALLAHVSIETGQVDSCQQSPDSSRVADFSMPFWDETLQLACDAHGVFPDLGICASDIAIGPGGPLILECSATPQHGLYQHASGRGIWNDDLAPIWDTLIARGSRRGHVRQHVRDTL